MNEKERIILQLVRNNPYITQQDLAERLELSRSAVAGYISSLTKSGDIIGRAYILNKDKQILCIGGANVDRKAKVEQEFQWKDSNPVCVSESVGGVARNIAENLSRLDVLTSLFTVTGYDQDNEKIWLSSSMIDRSASLQINGERTGTYTAVLDSDNEMMFALADMDIYDSISIDDMNKVKSHIRTSDMLIVDTNFPKNVLQEIFHNKGKNQILAVVPVSAQKINRLPDVLSNVDFMILNKDELDAITKKNSLDISLNTEQKMTDLQKQGVKNVIVTQGKQGVFYLTASGEHGAVKALPATIKDVTGAGDAFASGVFYAIYNDLSLEDACKYGVRLAKFTLETEDSVAKNLDDTIFNLE